MKKKLLVLPLLFSMLLGGCNTKKEEDKPSDFKVDKQYVYGMTDLSYQEEGVDYRYTHKLFKNMGVKSVRLWMHCNWVMSSPNDYYENGLNKMKRIYNDMKDEGYQIIAMNHSNFHVPGLVNSSSTTAKPGRDLTEGSYYMTWLNDLETTYYNMVKAFPDIEYWEIDNECNNDDFMPKLGGGSFTLEEKAQVYYDMMYYASRGIHRANPNATTVMGGLIVSNAESFLTYIYDLIASENSWSKNPDDYFQVACWHPYMQFFSKKKFIELNNDIYKVVKEREGKDKKVFLTEMGFSEGNGFSTSEIADYVKDIYSACKDDLYYVESMHYFRMYDDYASTWGSDAEKTFGLFYDPKNEKLVDNVKVRDLAEPKPGATAFKEIAGGTGALDVYQEFLKGNYDTKLVMHRGYSSEIRENTVEAFEEAGKQSEIYAIETDVHLTSDKKAIIMHDDTLTRVTNGKSNLNVNEATFEEVRNIKLPDAYGNPNVHTIPTMEEYVNVLKKYNKHGFLELKSNFSQSDLKIIFDELKSEIDLSNMTIISFHKETLTTLRSMYPDLDIYLLVNNINETSIEELKQYNFGIAPAAEPITEADIANFQENKIKIDLWTIDDKTVANKYGRLGVDFITSNGITSFKN